MKKAASRIALGCLLLPALLSCGALQSSGPPADLVERDIKDVAQATCVRTYTDAEQEWKVRKFGAESFEREGTSVEGKVARVTGTASVSVSDLPGPTFLGKCTDGGGFDSWLESVGIRDFADLHTKHEAGARFRFRVTLVYRLYDSGWKLESLG